MPVREKEFISVSRSISETLKHLCRNWAQVLHQAEGHLLFEGRYLYAAHEDFMIAALCVFVNTNKMHFSTLPK